MCLAVPGKIIKVDDDNKSIVRVATVDFNGTSTEVSLILTPDAGLDDYVLVHAGHAIEVIDQKAAAEIWSYLNLAMEE